MKGGISTKSKFNAIGIALAISSVALFVSAVNVIFCAVNKADVVNAAIIFCCMTAVLCSNIAIYSSAKKKNDN